MSKELFLEAEIRKTDEKINKIREAEFVPAVLYGANVENINLKVKGNDFANFFSKAGKSKIFTLKIGKDERKVIIKSVQKDHLKDDFSHIDFHQISEDRKLIVNVPLNFIGESRAAKKMGGILLTNKKTVKVKCLPADLMEVIDIDLSKLDNFSDSIRVNSLELSDKVEIMAEPGELIANVVAPKTAKQIAEEEAREEAENKPDAPAEEAEGEAEEEDKGEEAKA